MSLVASASPLPEGAILTHQELIKFFAVGASGGIRYRGSDSDPEYAVVITSAPGSYTDRVDRRRPYRDRWDGETLLYTGEGKIGPQELTKGNLALYMQRVRQYPIYLFRQAAPNQYQYIGQAQVRGFYEEDQLDELDQMRRVFVFKMTVES